MDRTQRYRFRPRSVLRRSLHKILKQFSLEKAGFHGFRRFRNTLLRQSGVPDGLIQFWMGHAPQSMTDVYDKCRNDHQFRSAMAEKVGLGFDTPGQGSGHLSPCDQTAFLTMPVKYVN